MNLDEPSEAWMNLNFDKGFYVYLIFDPKFPAWGLVDFQQYAAVAMALATPYQNPHPFEGFRVAKLAIEGDVYEWIAASTPFFKAS